jgi:vacuolar protein sorting-associated protein 13A/C
MAKRLLLNLLVSVLGDYIEGLTEDNLKLAVWSGEIALENLQVNRNILQRLNLPIAIIHGSVKSLQVTIPWATLESNPVRIVIDGVYLMVSPIDLSRLDAEDLTARALQVKQYKLHQVKLICLLSNQTLILPLSYKRVGR